ARELRRRYPYRPDDPTWQVVHTGRALLYPEISDETIGRAGAGSEELQRIHELGLRSAIIAPLVARGRVLGAIALVAAESGRRYGETELHAVEELGRHAGAAIGNALLYQEAQAERAKIHELFMHTPAAVSILRGPKLVYELSNPEHRLKTGGRPLV